ncbi:MAG: thiamine phosphate synthase [Deltaproteobacteria bacterium]|nr:thiamine phosphate synthase [Deltaproteobacteria bacterium]
MTFKLYIITDRRAAAPRTIEEIIEAALANLKPGEAAVQLREKDPRPRELYETALRLVKIVHRRGCLLVVNDRADVARAAGADGVHLGRSSMPVEAARKALPGGLIGVSTHSVADAEQAEKEGADFIVTGPVFATASKPGVTEPMGVAGLSGVCRAVRVPVYALGGMDSSNAAAVAGTGAAGVALIRGVMSAPDPGRAAMQIVQTVACGTGAGRRGTPAARAK